MPEQRRFVTQSPENSETPLDQVRGWVTPNPLFFVRNHFPMPTIDLAKWKLRIEGCVEHAMEWTLDELMALPERSVFATVECAGNGRSFLAERMPGVQWGAGAIGHAEWTGVPLKLLLDRAKLKPEAIEILFEGADRGSEADHPEPMNFERSLPLEKALHADTILAYRMNGELLDPAHGAPLRLFVPGWYGVASVKWLTRIAAIDHAFKGYFQTTKYTMRRTGKMVIVGPMAVKSDIIRPKPGETLGLGANRIVGLAWAGEEAIKEVVVSTDGGQSWAKVNLIGPQAPYSWTLWEYIWEVAQPGKHTLMARATSAGGLTQPNGYDHNNLGYVIHFSRTIDVEVKRDTRAAATTGDYDALLWDMNAYAEENRRAPLDLDVQFVGGSGI
jgi:DMSO/TMAO reductase YedYZ molybdopterin-dependent catalytic subunit